MNLPAILHGLTTTATCIGFVVMFAWAVLIVWLISVVIGEFRFSRLVKRRMRIDFEDRRSSSLRNEPAPSYARNRFDDSDEFTTILPRLPLLQDVSTNDIRRQFHSDEDEFPTEETGAVFDISERYPNEFA